MKNTDNKSEILRQKAEELLKRKSEDKILELIEELAFQNEEKTKRADELIIANKELAFQNQEKAKRADELIIANKELSFRNEEKIKRADELLIAKKEIAFQAELIIAKNKAIRLTQELELHHIELEMQNKELSCAKEKAETDAKKYAELYDFAPSGYFTLSNVGMITEINFSGATMLGKDRSQLKDNRFGFFVSNDTKSIFNLFLDKVFSSNANESCDVTMSTMGKSPKYVHLTGIVTKNREQCFVTAVDITLRKQAENKLREKDVQFRKLSSNLPDLIFQFTRRPDGTYYVPIASKGIINIFGCSPEDVVDDFTPIGRVIFPEDAERVISDIEYSAKHLTYFTCEFRVQIPGKPIQWIFSRSTPEKLADGSITWYGFNANITEIKQTEFELIRAKEKAEESDRLKTAFMNNISHEIRTPLNGILGFSQLMADPDLTPDEREQYLKRVKSSSNRLINTVTDFMDMSLIASENQVVHKKPFSSIGLLEELFYLFFEPCQGKNVKLSIQTPSIPGKVNINSDRELLYNALHHLLDNAVKFTKKGTVTFGFEIKGNELEFFVKDTGVGINKEVHATIFDKFMQENASDIRGYEGSGLGLPIAKGMIELLGGRIWVESTKGVGSTFFFTLPFEMTATEIPVNQETILDSNDKPLFLIVEDEPSGSHLLEHILYKKGVDILVVNNGQKAVAACRQNPKISLVLMDLKMPVMDGFEATKKIKSFCPHLPVIAITAFALSGDKKKALEAGCDDYISKPFDIELLLGKLKKYGLLV